MKRAGCGLFLFCSCSLGLLPCLRIIDAAAGRLRRVNQYAHQAEQPSYLARVGVGDSVGFRQRGRVDAAHTNRLAALRSSLRGGLPRWTVPRSVKHTA